MGSEMCIRDRRVTATDVASAKILLAHFKNLSLEVVGESVQTMTFHALTHLPDQVNLFGPLWTTSAKVFENAYRHLKKYVTGTRCAGSLIVKRFLMQKMMPEVSVTNTDAI